MIIIMKSAPIERLRQNQQERRDERRKTRVQDSPVISEEPTTFFIGQKEYSYSFKGFAKAIFHGVIILLCLGLVLFLLCFTLFFI